MLFDVMIRCGNDGARLSATIQNIREMCPGSRVTILADCEPYETEPNLFSVFSDEMKMYGTAVSSRPFTEILAELKGDAVIFANAGDTFDSRCFEYVRYFLEDNPDCPVVFFPIVNEDGSLPNIFQNLPPGGIVSADERGIPRLAQAVGAARTPALQKLAAETQADIKTGAFFARLAVRGKNHGMLNTVVCRRDTDETSALPLPMEWIACIGDAEPPKAILEQMKQYYEERADMPIAECGEGFEQLARFLRAYIETEQKMPAVSILSAANYYTDVELSGVFTSEQDSAQPLKVKADTELISLTVEPLLETGKDFAVKRFRFIARARLDDNRAGLIFKQGRKLAAVETNFENARNFQLSVDRHTLNITKIATRPYYRCTCVIPAYNAEKYIKEALDSIINQSLDFYPYIQMIIVNDGSTDGTGAVCAEYAEKYPYNVIYIAQENMGVSAARNNGLRYAMGEFVLFLDADDTIEPELLAEGIKFLNEKANKDIDFVTFPIRSLENGIYTPTTSKRFTKKAILDVEKDCSLIQYSACGSVIRMDALSDVRFDESLYFAEDAAFMHNLILKKMKYGVMDKPYYNYRKTGESAMSQKTKNINWYLKNNLFGEIIAKYSIEKHAAVTRYTQYLTAYQLLDSITEEPAPDGFDAEASFAAVGGILQNVGDDIINSITQCELWMKKMLLRIKNAGNDAVAEEEEQTEVLIDYMRETGGVLRITGHYAYDLPRTYSPVLAAEYKGLEYAAREEKYERLERFFLGRCVRTGVTFEFEIACDGSSADDIYFRNANVQYSQSSDQNFFVGRTLIVKAEADRLRVEAVSPGGVASLLRGYAETKKDKALNELIEEYIGMYPLFAGSRIWLFSDEPSAANGDASVMFKYCAAMRDGMDKYFAIRKDSLDEYGMSQIGSTVEYGSLMHKALYLFAEKVIVSDLRYAAPSDDLPFGLINSELVYLPRAVLNKSAASDLAAFTKTRLTVILTSEDERELLAGSIHDDARVLGSPVYDELADGKRNERHILFMPDWRRDLYPGENKLNFKFRDSEYCVKIGDLLLDDRLLTALEERGIALDFAPHEKTYIQLGDFERDDSVKVLPPSRRGIELCKNADMLITDSLPAYDFAYMGKPVIYWRFADSALPADGGRFGETVEDFERLIDLIIACADNDFAVPETFAKESARFFAYRDGKSRERIYEYTV